MCSKVILAEGWSDTRLVRLVHVQLIAAKNGKLHE